MLIAKKITYQYILFILAARFFFSGTSLAEEPKGEPQKEPKPRCFKSVEFLTGFSKAKLRSKDAYIMSPFIVAFNFDLKPFLARKLNFRPWGVFAFQLEPYIAPVYQPNTNIEIGNGFVLKIGILPEDRKLQPYIKLDPGILYMTQHTREQATQFNFFEAIGVGMNYFFTKNNAFTLEYRFRHASNCAIKRPNGGIESQFALAGIVHQF